MRIIRLLLNYKLKKLRVSRFIIDIIKENIIIT